MVHYLKTPWISCTLYDPRSKGAQDITYKEHSAIYRSIHLLNIWFLRVWFNIAVGIIVRAGHKCYAIPVLLSYHQLGSSWNDSRIIIHYSWQVLMVNHRIPGDWATRDESLRCWRHCISEPVITGISELEHQVLTNRIALSSMLRQIYFNNNNLDDAICITHDYL